MSPARAGLFSERLFVYDSTDVSAIPDDAQGIAAYADGQYANVLAADERFGRARVLTVTVRSNPLADIADCEQWDMTPLETAVWIARARSARSRRPIVYVELAGLPDLVEQLAAHGVPRDWYRLWSAHWTDAPHICDAACGLGDLEPPGMTQYASLPAGRRVDVSLTTRGWWAAVTAGLPRSSA